MWRGAARRPTRSGIQRGVVDRQCRQRDLRPRRRARRSRAGSAPWRPAAGRRPPAPRRSPAAAWPERPARSPPAPRRPRIAEDEAPRRGIAQRLGQRAGHQPGIGREPAQHLGWGGQNEGAGQARARPAPSRGGQGSDPARSRAHGSRAVGAAKVAASLIARPVAGSRSAPPCDNARRRRHRHGRQKSAVRASLGARGGGAGPMAISATTSAGAARAPRPGRTASPPRSPNG